MDALSEFEELVLLAVGMVQGGAYGYAVKEAIRMEAGRRVSLATVHAALYRLEKKGLLTSRMGGATAERGGRRKRLFALTGAGVEALQATYEIRTRMWQVVEQMHVQGGLS